MNNKASMRDAKMQASASIATPFRYWLGLSRVLLTGLFLSALAAPAAADSVADFYKGKVVRILIGSAAGGEYDVLGRLVGRHLGKHIPGNPSVIGVNMPGAFALNQANHLYLNAERDGTTIGTINNGLPLMETVGGEGVRFKAAEFEWIGSTSAVTSMMIAWHSKGVKTIEDARNTELVAGSMGRGNLTYVFPALMNDLIGTRFKIVVGYRGGSEINLAMERGEVDARSATESSLRSINTSWLRENKINFLVQAGARSTTPELQSLPMVEDLARNAEDRAVIELIMSAYKMGRPFTAPPGVPPERLAALRKAFVDVMKDPEFRQEAKTIDLDVDPVSGAQLQAIMEALQRMPKNVAQRAKKYFE
jgi:tripartite-type tricarboxylate transporter receptor subunit TctC